MSAQKSAASTIDRDKLSDLELQLESKTSTISSMNKTVQSLKQV